MMPDECDDILLDNATEQFEEVDVAQVLPIPVVLAEAAVTEPIYPQHMTAYTIVLTATTPTQELAPLDSLRTGLIIRSLDHDVVLCHSINQANDPSNFDVALAFPNGAVLRNGDRPTYLRSTPRMWVVGNSYPSRVTVIAERRAT